MVQAICIGQFKAYSQTQRLICSPVTLLYGANSSGKSSFLHGILYIAEALATGNFDIHESAIGGPAIDLGGFPKFVYRHGDGKRRDETRSLFEFELKVEEGVSFEHLPRLGRVPLALEVGIGIGHAPSLLRLALGDRGSEVLVLERLDGEAPFSCMTFEGASEDLEVEVKAGFQFRVSPPAVALQGLLDEISREILRWCADLVYLGPLRAWPPRDLWSTDEVPLPGEGWASWQHLMADSPLRDGVNAWLAAVGESARFDAWDYFPDYRLKIAAQVIQSSVFAAARQEVGCETAESEGTRPEAVLERAEAMLASRIENWANEVRGRFEQRRQRLYVEDKGTFLTHRDIGSGYTQALPVLVAALREKGKMILVEQPELHLHPRLQCDLADVIVESALTRDNVFVLETHSEHFLLRLMRRLRERAEGKVRPSWESFSVKAINAVYVSRGDSGSRLDPWPLDPAGEGFVGSWPDEFFGERLEELR